MSFPSSMADFVPCCKRPMVGESNLSNMFGWKISLNNWLVLQSHPTFKSIDPGGGGGVLPYKGLMGTCGQPGYVFQDFCLKQGIEFIIFCLNQGIDLSVFVLNRMSFLE